MADRLIYLDNNATSQVDEKVFESMLPYLKEEYANPSSMYGFAKRSSDAVKEARVKVRDFFNASNEKEIIFTSCGSEGDNMAIRGVLDMDKSKRHIITTKVEHPAVLNVYKYLEKQGYKTDYINVNSNGELVTINSTCMDTDKQVPLLMHASKAILENVIFCHQEEINWPFSESGNLKKVFDEIFDTAKYTKALDDLKEIGKKFKEKTKDLKNQLELIQKDV